MNELFRPWDRRLRFAGTDECAPPPPAPGESGVQVWRTATGETIACGFRTAGRYWMHWPSFATYGFAADDPFVSVYPTNAPSTAKVRDIYRRSVLPMALQAFGFEAMHASAVAEDRGVVVFAARSGTGKSTIAFGLSRRGYRQWSDDAVVFHSSSDGPIAAPLPFTVRLRPPSAELVGTPAAHMTPPDRLPARILAVCVLSRMDHVDSNRAAIIRRLDPSVAFRALLTHAHEFDPANLERRRRTLEAYLDLAASVPTYDVMFRHGRDAFEPLLDQIVDSVGLPAGRACEPIGA